MLSGSLFQCPAALVSWLGEKDKQATVIKSLGMSHVWYYNRIEWTPLEFRSAKGVRWNSFFLNVFKTCVFLFQ